jgi:hypothetical protein
MSEKTEDLLIVIATVIVLVVFSTLGYYAILALIKMVT